MLIKKCCTCKQEKLVGDFNKNSSTKDGLHRQCKSCIKEYRDSNASKIKDKVKESRLKNAENIKQYSQKYREEHKEELKLYAKKYRDDNKEQIKQKEAEKYKILKENTPEKIMFYMAKARAKRKNIPFSIEVSDIVIPKFCPILGIELEYGKGKPQDSSPSLDKIIPKLGYVKGNIQVISRKANTIKTDASIEELLLFSRWILENYSNKEEKN
jgi:hypothetical protein